MSTTTAAPVSSTIALTDLTVEEGFNPRGEIDAETIGDLISSIKKDGILQPVLARRDGNKVSLIAGHRRVYAAKKAGLSEVPVLIREDVDEEEAAALAFDENEQRESMVPIARAIALKAQVAKLGSFKKVGARRSMSPQQVGALVKMCDLPDEIQKIALQHREFGPALAKVLVPVAETPGGEPVAIMLAEQAMKSAEFEEAVRKSLDRALTSLIQLRKEKDTPKARATVPFVSTVSQIDLPNVFDDPQIAQQLDQRAIGAEGVLGWDCRTITTRGGNAEYDSHPKKALVSLDDAALDRLKASGVLFTIEVKRGPNWSDEEDFVFDAEALRTEIEEVIKSAEKAATWKVKQNAKEKAAELKKKAADPDALKTEDGEVMTERQVAKEEARIARTNNEAIGKKLLARSGKPATKKTTLELTRLMATVFVRQADSLAGIGMRLCFESWKEAEVKELKSGETREKIHYLEAGDAKDRLLGAIEKAKSVEEIHRIISDAIVAATFSDERELPMSKRLDNSWGGQRISNVRLGDRQFIDSLAKGALPEDAEKERLASVERGYDSAY